jgi:hypothetical protein
MRNNLLTTDEAVKNVLKNNLVGIEEAKEYLKRGAAMVQRLSDEGYLPYYEEEVDGRRLYDPDDLRRYFEQRKFQNIKQGNNYASASN